jgi:hypothetical protein
MFTHFGWRVIIIIKHILVVIIGTAIMLIGFNYLIPFILKLIDPNVIQIPFSKYYLIDVFKYDKRLGILGYFFFIIVYSIVFLLFKKTSK